MKQIKVTKLLKYILKNAEVNIASRDKIDAYDRKALKFIYSIIFED